MMHHQHHWTTVFDAAGASSSNNSFLSLRKWKCVNARSHFQMTDVATRSCQHHRSPSDRYKNRINAPIPWINFRPNLAFHLIEYDELNRLPSIRSGVMVRKRLCTLAQNFRFNIYRFADNLRLMEESSFTFLYITESRAVIQITGSFFPITLILK